MRYDVRSIEQLNETGQNLILRDASTSGIGTTEERLSYALNHFAGQGYIVVGLNDNFVILAKEDDSNA